MNLFIIPIINSQWQIVAQNMFILEKLKRNISYFKDCEFFEMVLNLVESVLQEHNEIIELERKIYGKGKEVGSILYKTRMIKLKAEYEMYNMILGRPKDGEKYNQFIIDLIRRRICEENISYDLIKKEIAEYEMYNRILGRPKEGEEYHQFIIDLIRKRIGEENISYDLIKKEIDGLQNMKKSSITNINGSV